ncbi:hypothetical protein ACJX0J_016220 [Zea mays]
MHARYKKIKNFIAKLMGNLKLDSPFTENEMLCQKFAQFDRLNIALVTLIAKEGADELQDMLWIYLGSIRIENQCLEKVADQLPGWKTELMKWAGRKVQVQYKRLPLVDTAWWLGEELIAVVPKQIKNSRTVQDALMARKWMAGIKGSLTVGVLVDFLDLSDALLTINLHPE